jgi:hypothetical protein
MIYVYQICINIPLTIVTFTMRKTLSLFLLCLAILVYSNLFAQSPQPTNTVKLFFEKTFIHTDRNIYAPGEDIWFKAYVVNARDNRLIATSKNLYVELISPADTIVNHQIVYLGKGMGNGDFALSTKLAAGTYKLRAYTNWSRNFGDNFIYEKSITITGSSETVKSLASVKSLAKPVNTTQLISNTSNSPVIRFFPEGGSLVNELSAMVAVKAEDAQGNGIAATGQVISAAGDTVARFSCDSLGMGIFAMLPLPGQTYSGVIKYKGQNITGNLPQALNSGLALKVVKKDTLIFITISGNNAAAAALAGKPLSIAIKHAGITVIDQQLQLKDNQALVKISQSLLPEGIAALTLYDDQHKPNCERLIYIDHGIHASKLNISTDKIAFKPREKVTINIKAADGNQHPVNGNYSIAVVDAGLNPAVGDNIKAYIMLQSDLKGNIEHADRYFDTTNVNRAQQLDMLLLTQGWRDFVWKKLTETPIKISYLPEQGFTLNGKVKKESNNTPIASANITLSIPKAVGQKLFFTQTDATGNYYFDNIPLLGQQNVRVSTRNIKGDANGVILLDSLSQHGLPINKTEAKLPGIPVANEIAAEIAKRAPINKALDSVTNLKEVKIKASRNVVLRDQTAITSGYPDEVLTVTKDDLTYSNLRHYILTKSKQAKNDPDPQATGNQIVFLSGGQTFKPRIIVDNTELPFTDDDDNVILDHYYDTYYSLSMDKVEKVVIKHLLGGLKPPPVADFTTTANAMGNSVAGAKAVPPKEIYIIYLTLKPGALLRNGGGITTANINGYYEARTFYKPVHNAGGFDSQKPDLRNTIYWEPFIKTDAQGNATVSFYNADPKTNVRIIVQGITDTGEPVNSVKNYVVK